MTELTRRRLVAAAGATGMGVIAGCTSSRGDGGDEDDDSADGTVLGEITVESLDDSEHTIDVVVQFGDDIEHWSTHELEAGGDGATLERDWPTDAGAFRVTVRLDGAEITQVTPARWNDPGCLNLLVLVGRDGEITMLSDTNGGPCGSGEAEFETAGEGENGDDD